MPTLRDIVYENVREGDLYEKLDRDRVRCYACGHCCPIPEGQPGVCKVRYNHGGTLYVPWGYVGGVQCDPIEKKPFFHAYPGALAYSFGMLGCDLHCGYCQNWVTSQALRDPNAVSAPLQATPEALVQDAVRQGAKVLVSTYNEPLITSEWAVAVFKEARRPASSQGLFRTATARQRCWNIFVRGSIFTRLTSRVSTIAITHQLGGRIGPILETIRTLHQMGVWLEVVTLLIPGFNDSEDELKGLTDFLAGVSPDIPWHVTAFHKDYKMDDPENTRPHDLLRAAEIGKKAGLRYVVCRKSPWQCGWPGRHALPSVQRNLDPAPGLFRAGVPRDIRRACPSCKTAIPGRWAAHFDDQIAAHPFLPRRSTRLVTIPS